MLMSALSNASMLSEISRPQPLDLRLVMGLAGDRELNAREQQTLEKITAERGESLFSDLLYTLTRKQFPSRQAKTVWADINTHRQQLKSQMGRDPGIAVAAHDYLSNLVGLIRGAGVIEEQKFRELASVASRDGLTGLYDKATFAQLLHDEMTRQARYGRPVTLVLIDIDHFKRLNDTFGHADGDVVLREVADTIQQQARTSDICGRFGGEEFAVLLPEVATDGGALFAERARRAVAEKFAATPYATTISVGVATAQPGIKPDELVRAADGALYAAKHAGRNAVHFAAEVVATV
jgi:diguanylate cyclase (GGDEF)-like protein